MSLISLCSPDYLTLGSNYDLNTTTSSVLWTQSKGFFDVASTFRAAFPSLLRTRFGIGFGYLTKLEVPTWKWIGTTQVGKILLNMQLVGASISSHWNVLQPKFLNNGRRTWLGRRGFNPIGEGATTQIKLNSCFETNFSLASGLPEGECTWVERLWLLSLN